MQDPTNNAMTELALGLSMAFFALLILALLSMASPSSVKTAQAKMTLGPPVSIDQGAIKTGDESNIQYAFYYKNRLIDESLKDRSIDSFVDDYPLVIAVDQNTSFAALFTLTQSIHHPQLSITGITQQWQTHLEQSL